MSFLKRLQSIHTPLYAVNLVVAAVLYFIGARWFQDSQTYHNFDMIDALQGFPIMPEPYEIPLYLLSYIAIPIIALAFYGICRWFYTPKPKNTTQLHNLSLAPKKSSKAVWWTLGVGVVALGLGALFFKHLPGADFVAAYFERRSVWHLFWLLFTKRLYLVRIAFGAGVLTFLYFWLVSAPKQIWLERIKTAWESSKVKKWIPHFFIFLVVLIVHPNFPSEENYINYILSPAHETLLGKPLLYETTSVYGVLNVYFTAFVMKYILPISYQTFVLVLSIFYFLFYAGLYSVLKKWQGSTTHALVGTWVAVVFGYLLLSDPAITPYNFPGQTAYRQGFYMLTLFLFAHYWHTGKRWFKELTLLASAISLFWNIDTGVYIVLATLATFTSIELFKHAESWGQRIKNIIMSGLHQLAYIVGVFAVITLANYAVYGAWPNWMMQIRDISTFKTGYGRFPIPAVGLFLFHIVTYTSFALYILKQLITKKTVHPITVFLTVFGIFSFLYYIGTSAWTYMHFTSIPMALLALHAFYQFLKKGSSVFSDRFVVALFFGSVMFVSILSVSKVPTVFAYRDYTQFNLLDVKAEHQDIYDDAQYIKEHFSDTRIPLFHYDDGQLLIMAGKINSLYLQENDTKLYSLYDDFLVVFKRQMQGLKNQMDSDQPEHVFISNTPDARMKEFEAHVQRDYSLETELSTLKIYKRNE